MNRWCPSCGRKWSDGRPACPDCLVELVDDPAATVRCRHCGKDWPARMQSCPECLAELRPDPAAATEALSDILAAGGHLLRPDDRAPFADGPACTLLRLSGQGPLVFLGPDGLVEAEVDGPGGRAEAPLTCRDVAGPVLFRLLRYEAAEGALVAVGADGAPVGTYLPGPDALDVRDGTSAPVATLRRTRGGHRLVETGGGLLAEVGSADVERDGWIDDQWWLQPRAARLPLPTSAVVALVLAAKATLGRPWPVAVREDRRPGEEWPPAG